MVEGRVFLRRASRSAWNFCHRRPRETQARPPWLDGGGPPHIDNLLFVIQVFLEERLGPLLLLWRRLVCGYPYRKIPLTQNQFARVDPEDYPALARHKWCASKQSNTFYAVRADGKRQLRMHRVIMNAPPGLVVDHIDHDGRNNTKRNLRLCTKSQNARNQRPQRGRSSKYIGVSYHKGDGKYHARIQDHGRQRFLGVFTSARDAARARDKAALQLHG